MKHERKAKKLQVQMFPKNDCLTPDSKSHIMVSAFHTDDKEHKQKVRRTLKFHFALIDELKTLKKTKKINQMAGGKVLKKYKLTNLFCNEMNMRKQTGKKSNISI